MKKIIYLLFLITSITYAQEYKIEEKTVTGVFELKEKTKTEIFGLINKWVALNYNSAKDVVQLSDISTGTIIVRGINNVEYKNYNKVIFPENKSQEENAFLKLNHVLEINIKDEKIRIIYKLTSLATEDNGMNEVVFNTINLAGVTPIQISNYNNHLENMFKNLPMDNSLTKFKSITEEMFGEISSKLFINVKKTMGSIVEINNSENQKW